METSFCELKGKEVINVVDGKRLGHITDIVFDLPTGQISGLIVPGDKNFWNVFSLTLVSILQIRFEEENGFYFILLNNHTLLF